MNRMPFNGRDLIGGAIALVAILALGVVAVIEAVHNQQFSSPPALTAVAGAAVAVFLSNAGTATVTHQITNGYITAMQTNTAVAAAAAVATTPRQARATDQVTPREVATFPATGGTE